MQIDWLTVAAQAANFLVLVWLLKRFLYGPVMRAMQKREAGIAARLAEAQKSRQEAGEEAETLRGKQRELDLNREGLLQEAREKARDLRQELEDELRESSDLRQRAWARQIAGERRDFLHDLRKRTGHQVLEVTRSVLREFAAADLSDQLADRFIEKLRALDPDKLQSLTAAAENRSPQALIESSIALSPPVRRRITKALHEAISDQITTEYVTGEDLALGLRLTIAEQAVEWSADAYLDQMESVLDDALETVDAPVASGGDR